MRLVVEWFVKDLVRVSSYPQEKTREQASYHLVDNITEPWCRRNSSSQKMFTCVKNNKMLYLQRANFTALSAFFRTLA